MGKGAILIFIHPRQRQIPMLADVKDAFLREKAYQEYNNLKCTVSVDGYTDFIFINRFGNVRHQGTVTLDIYTTVTKELKKREFGDFERKLE